MAALLSIIKRLLDLRTQATPISHLYSAVNSGYHLECFNGIYGMKVSGIQAVKAGGQSSLCSSKLKGKPV